MGPFFALLHELGLSPWLVQRLWLGTLLALAAWGVVRLLDALLGRPRGAAHVAAAVLFVVNPYVVVFSSRTTITLLGYALLPWLLLVVHRGLRDPRRWWWAAAFALLVTSSGGGVNAAVTGWLLVGPLLLVLYEPLVCGVPWASVRAFAWRAAVAGVAASIWWLLPVLVQAAYGIDFLKFTEQVGSIWNTTSLPESLRLMGYWPSYLGVGYTDTLRPYFGDSGTLLFNPLVLVASLLVPALSVWGFVWTRRWRYGPFFLLLALAGLLVMSVGFPEGTPLRKAATFTYNHVSAVQFLRTTYKAGPLLALGLAGLGGGGFAGPWGGGGGGPGPGGGGAVAAGGRGRGRGRARRGAPGGRGGRGGFGRALARRRRARPGRAARVRRAPVLPGPRGRAHLEAHPGRVAGRCFRARPRFAAWVACAGAARPAVRVLPLGRDRRPDPALPHRTPGRDPQRAAVRRPARRRPPVDDRQPRSPAAPAPRRAAVAARPAERPCGGERHGRRRGAQRRHATRRG